MTFVYLLLIVNIVSIIVCGYIAMSRGVNPAFWSLMGGIFGLFAIPFVLQTEPKELEEPKEPK